MNIGPIIRAMNHNRTRVFLIVVEIAITLAIVTNCINIILDERAKMLQRSGFDDDNIVHLRVRPFTPEFTEAAFVDTITDADVRTIGGIPGVRAVANTSFQFWEGGGSSTHLKPAGGSGEPIRSQIYWSTRDITAALGAQVVEGRGFVDGDHGVGAEPDPANVILISREVAELLFPGQTAVGKSVQRTTSSGEATGDPVRVVGVIGEFHNPYGMPGEANPIENRAIFLPSRVGGYQNGIRYLIRTEPGAMTSVIGEVEKRLAAANPGRAFEFMRMDEKRERWFSGSKIVVTTMTGIIVALVAVTALGLLGLTSLSVAERTKQIGTRRALGATRGDVLRHFLVENALVTSLGLVLGIGAAYALNFLLVSHVSDVKLGWDLIGAGIVLLWINGLIATIPPAIRAMSISPALATRSI